MFDLIEKLRKKSERTKKIVAASVALLFCAVILFFWISSVFPQAVQQKEISDRVQSVEPSPFSTFVQIVSQGVSGIGGDISKLKSVTSSLGIAGTEVISNATGTPAAANSQGTTTGANSALSSTTPDISASATTSITQ